MFKPQLLVLLLSGLVITKAPGDLAKGKLDINRSQSTIVTLYSDKALISQQFTNQPDIQGMLEISGLPLDRLDDSLSLEYLDGEAIHRPEEILWYQGGLDRDNYYRNLVGKTVDVFGEGLDAVIKGELTSYQQGVGLVEGNNGRQYFIDYHDPRGLRILSRESAKKTGSRLDYLMADFGHQLTGGTLRLSWITSLLNYDSHYRLTLLSDNQGRLELKALLANSSNINFQQARVLLVSGGEGGVPGYYRKSRMLEASSVADAGEYGERVGEVLVTTLPGDTVIPANSKQLLELFSEVLHLEKIYTLDIYGRSSTDRTAVRPRLTWTFDAPLDLPPAAVRMYEQNTDGSYIIGGNAWLPKTTAGDKVWMTMGEALAVRVEQSQLDIKQKGDREYRITSRLTVANDQEEMVTVLVTERDPNLLQLESVEGATLAKPDQIRIDVAANSKKAIHFTGRYRH